MNEYAGKIISDTGCATPAGITDQLLAVFLTAIAIIVFPDPSDNIAGWGCPDRDSHSSGNSGDRIRGSVLPEGKSNSVSTIGHCDGNSKCSKWATCGNRDIRTVNNRVDRGR